MSGRSPSPLAFGLLVAVVVAYLFCVPQAASKDGDFAHLWVGGRALVTAGPGSLYDPATHRALLEAATGALNDPLPPDLWAPRNDRLGAFFYPPVTALLLAPLGLLSLRVAAGLHAVAFVAGALGCAALLARHLGGLGLAGMAALILLFPSTFFGFALGQNGLWALLVVLIALALDLRGRPLWAGLVLGLLAAKPSWWIAAALVAPLALRRPRLMGGMVLGAVGMVAAGLLIGLEPTVAFWRLAPQVARLEQLPDYPLHLQHDLLGLGRRWLGMDAGTVAGWGAALGLVGLTAWRAPRLPRAEAWGLVAVAVTLVNPHVHHYDLLVGLVGVAALAARGARGAHRWAIAAVVILHHSAFVVEEALGLDRVVSLPALALVGVWALLAFGRPASLPGGPGGPQAR